MKTFNYCATHREDEAYMKKMCARGWAATGLVEGVWSFEPCKPNEYCYRVCYLRGKTKEETKALREELDARGIEFVSRYSFWAIFRSRAPFELYTRQEEQAICQKIYAPMPVGAVISWLLCGAGLLLSCKVSLWFLIFTVLIGIYGAMCTWLALSYRKLLNEKL